MNEESTDLNDPRTEGGAWIVWGVLVAVAVAVYEVSQQPALLGITIALKFAWGDARTGWWIRQRDPNRPRGTAHFWLYLGFGFWKAAGAAFVLGVLFASIDNFVRRPAARPMAQNVVFFHMVVGSVLGSVALATLGSLACLTAFQSAIRRGFKLWLHSRVAADRVRNRFPPTQGESNAIVWMGYAAGITLMILLLLVFLVLFAWVSRIVNGAIAGLILLPTIVALTLRVAKIIDRRGYETRFRAASPEAVWSDVPVASWLE